MALSRVVSGSLYESVPTIGDGTIMKTTATNRRVRELLTSLKQKKLIPDPDFQRRLVWSNKDKSKFIETVLLGYPFPEVYVAAGEVDVETGEGTELLVDGQQRVTTLYQYFHGSTDLILSEGVRPYSELSREQKEAFLQYDVVVRDLGSADIEVIRAIFRRINATRYALNAMEVANARYEGAFKLFAEEFAQRPFFETHRVFSANEIKRMQDTRFVVVIASTILSTYFHRDDEIEEFLSRYNDEFPMQSDLQRDLDSVLEFIDEMQMPSTSRLWKKADLFTIIVELHRALFKRQLPLNPGNVSKVLSNFYQEVDSPETRREPESAAARYYSAALAATNDRMSRIRRGEIIADLLKNTARLVVHSSNSNGES